MAIDRPTISIVTPSLNQGQFLEETMCSILRQAYPRVEYVVMDGGSSDGSADIIRRYADQLTYWESRPDQGFYDAINRGFSHTAGEIMGWLNSDDKYMPWAFSVIADIFATFPEVEWITSVYPASWNERGQAVAVDFTGGFSGRSFFKGGNFPGEGSYGRRWIQQESTFWRRSLWERAGGGLNTNYQVAADFELWARFFQLAELHGVGALLGGFRAHGNQLSVHRRGQYMNESESVLRSYGQGPCNGLERACRGLFWKVFRQYSLGQLPPWVSKGLFASGLLFPTKVAVWTGKEWEIITGFSV